MHAAPAPAVSNREFGKGLARAYAGALIFGLPLFMTMEMWELGVHLPAWKLVTLLVLFFPFLVVLSWHVGFEDTFSWRGDVVDALVAYGVGFTASAAALGLIGVLTPEGSLREAVGKVTLQAVPGSIGALLAQSQLGERGPRDAQPSGEEHWASEVFIMAVGALFLSFNLAPTQEMLLIALRIGAGQALLLMAVSLALMHAFVYGVAFRGQPAVAAHESGWPLFLRFTVVGYALALLLSAFMLWMFGSLEGSGLVPALKAVAVLGFPAAIGAAAARLIL
ncbi:TIGR02587 family membrane protein [Ramlibacter rhizophilus]|uniref:TIGR02587 family membrane protein n=1 Tax=Ramlibacter rhizophilus TaxID=1781167 RepID=A0A4Z0BRE0_9BURK|nr:TIGR02587 family membrane protein [Ramlibacter rhizophilus]TFZ01024.1 TIGR02587 family membrane protein [Ramlibacter rhizophilus]